MKKRGYQLLILQKFQNQWIVQHACCLCNIKKKQKENLFGNVSDVGKNIIFLQKMVRLSLKKHGDRQDNFMYSNGKEKP